MISPAKLSLGMKLRNLKNTVKPEVSTNTWLTVSKLVDDIFQILDEQLPDEETTTETITELETIEITPVPVLTINFDINAEAARSGWIEAIRLASDLKARFA